MNKNVLIKVLLFAVFATCMCLRNSAIAEEQPFPIIMYDVPPSAAAFEEVKNWGVNYVHKYSMGMSVEKDQEFFDLAKKYQLKVAANLHGNSYVGKEGGVEKMKAYVQHFSNDSALGFWYLYDEPDNKGIKPQEIQPFYEMIKDETPSIPVALCHAWTKHWYSFNKVQDILINDIYPVTGAPFPQANLQHFTKFTKAALNGSKLVIPVVQFFNWQGLAKPDQTELRGYPVKELRYPNSEEMRYMCFSTIAQGVSGLAFYSYARRTPPEPAWAKSVAAPVLREVRQFATEALDSGQLLWQNKGENFVAAAWENNNKKYVIVANITAEKQNFILEQDFSKNKLQPWGDTRNIKTIIDKNKVTIEQVDPWEIFIWEVISKENN